MVELGLEQPRFAGGRAVMKHEARAGRVQPPGNRGADTLGATGDQHDPALHAALPDNRIDLNAI